LYSADINFTPHETQFPFQPASVSIAESRNFKLQDKRKQPVIEFTLNGKPVSVDVPPGTPLLWVVREELGLTGTKFGCGKALCGACTMHLDGSAIRTCVLPVSVVAGREVTTIEGLGDQYNEANASNSNSDYNRNDLHPLQQAWIANNVPQCGYCQAGQIMQAAALLENNDSVSQQQITNAMNGNLCRCGTYSSINNAIVDAAKAMGKL